MKKLIKPPQRVDLAVSNERQNNIEKSWLLLRSAIDEIFRKNSSSLSFEELYRTAYNLVLSRQGALVYNKLRETFEEHLKEWLDTKLAPVPNDKLIRELSCVWSDYTLILGLIRDIFMYLDRVHVKSAKVLPIFSMGLEVFRQSVMCTEDGSALNLCSRLVSALLVGFTAERDGMPVERAEIKSAIELLNAIPANNDSTTLKQTLYDFYFEGEFSNSTAVYYSSESARLLQRCSVYDYLKKAEERVEQETTRLNHYLPSDSSNKVMRVVDSELISRHTKKLLMMDGSGLYVMINQERIDDISRMFRLFRRCPESLAEMRAGVGNFIRAQGKRMREKMQEEKSKSYLDVSVEWVNSVLSLKKLMEKIHENCLDSDMSFHTSILDALNTIINENSNASEIIALYADDSLDKKTRKTEEEISKSLGQAIQLVRFLNDKDVFERYYKQNLAKRLLYDRSMSEDLEREFITKLRTECGYQFTNRMEGMFNDIKLNSDISVDFKERAKTLPFEFSTKVLTSTFWPISSKQDNILLPEDFAACMQTFTKFYDKRHNGRKLTWLVSMGSIELRARFNDRQYEVVGSLLQGLILLQYNHRDEITFKDLCQNIGAVNSDIIQNVHALLLPKSKLLTKAPSSKDFGPNDIIRINSNFRHNQFKIKLPTIKKKITNGPDDNPDDKAKILEERRPLIDAAIVRIMKSRKTLEHQQLIAEVTRQLSSRFQPDPAVIKIQIEQLIEREFLERDKSDMKLYRYV